MKRDERESMYAGVGGWILVMLHCIMTIRLLVVLLQYTNPFPLDLIRQKNETKHAGYRDAGWS